MTGAMRTSQGGRVDRSRPIGFTFDGKRFQGLAGDTLASALIANGVHLMGRSFKYHRPRGALSMGSDEPNALVTVDAGQGRVTPNLRATQVEIYEGLTRASQNAWPSLERDAMAVNGALSPFFPAGFYYKTFIGPQGAWEHLYEPAIRRAAGLGVAPTDPDADHYAYEHRHCEVAVVGAGPAGLAAARAAARSGAARHPVRRAGGVRRLAARRTARADRRQAGGRMARRRRGRTGARCPTSRCCRARRCSAITRRISSPPSSASPTISPPPIRSCRASGFGRCAPSGSSSRPARTSARWCFPTTTGRGSCWPIPRARSPRATASSRARGRRRDDARRRLSRRARSRRRRLRDRHDRRQPRRRADGACSRRRARAACPSRRTRRSSARAAACASRMRGWRGCGRTAGRASPTRSPATSSP